MLVPFLIMLREGVEAALIVSIIASYLAQTGRFAAMRGVWIGVVLAAVLCTALGVALNLVEAELPQRIQELFEAAVGLLAVIVLTSMVFWMRRAGRNIKAELHASVDAAFERSPEASAALVAMAFFAVAREGLESVFFLLAAFQQDVGIEAPIGAVLGILAAVFIGVVIYRGGRRLDLKRFFRWTGVVILFVAAGLLAGVVRSLHEAGLWNGLQAIVFDLSETLPADGVLGTLLSGFFGYRDAPTLGEVSAYLIFLLPMLFLFLRQSSPPIAAVPRVAASHVKG